jgi:hypothetical protein
MIEHRQNSIPQLEPLKTTDMEQPLCNCSSTLNARVVVAVKSDMSFKFLNIRKPLNVN